jgi:hypothetical protein
MNKVAKIIEDLDAKITFINENGEVEELDKKEEKNENGDSD